MNSHLFSMIICLSKESLEFKYYEKLILDFADNFGYHIQLDGRPFEYKEIEKVLDLLKMQGIKEVGIRTSEKINSNIIEMIKKYSIRSLMFREKNEFLNYNIDFANKNNIPVEISVILQKDNIEKIDNIIEYYNKKKISLLVFERSIIAKYRNEYYNPLEPQDYKNIMEKIIEYNHLNTGMGIAISHCPNKILLHKEEKYKNNIGGCSAGIVSCAISEYGDIIPCLPLYEIIVGNIKKDNIIELWNKSEIFNKLRDRTNIQGKCKECEFLLSCGGCRAESYYETNNLFEEDKTCWREEI